MNTYRSAQKQTRAAEKFNFIWRQKGSVLLSGAAAQFRRL